MTFTHDARVALAVAAALVNTAGRGDDGLSDAGALDALLRDQGWTVRGEPTAVDLRQVRELRSLLRRIWHEDEDGIVGIVNALLRESSALPQLVKHDGEPYHLHATRPDAPLATRVAVEAAMAFVDVVRSGELSRLRICERPDCGNVVVDLSKNRSKRFCDTGCGNRAAVAAYRARKASASRPEQQPDRGSPGR